MVTTPLERVEGGYCGACRTLALPLSEAVSFLRRLAGEGPRAAPPVRPATAPMARRREREIDERDRVFAFLFMLPLELSEDVRAYPPGVTALIIACGAVLGLTTLSDGEAARPLVLQGGERLATLLPHLLTNVWVHFGLLHLLGNMYFLYAFGRLLEERLDSPLFLGLFMACGVSGSVAFTLVHRGETITLGGASGAIAGLMGCYLVLFPWRMVGLSLFFGILRIPALVYLGIWFFIQVASVPYQETGVAYSAHAGGCAAGILAGIAVRIGLLPTPGWEGD
jgi:membrane associated rhomboid family serine protease